MRIVQLIDSLEAGGAERMAVNYANALADKIDFSGLVVTRKEGPLLKTISNECSYLFLEKKKTLDFKSIFRLKRYIVKNNVNIVHAHGTSFFTAVLLKLISPKIKIVWHEHYGARVLQSSKDGLILMFCSLFFSAVFVVNKKLEFWVKQHLFCKKVFYIPNFAILLPNIIKSTVLKGVPGKRIVCLANLKKPKNHLDLIKCFYHLQLNKLDWSLHLIGEDYQDDYSRQLKEFLDCNNLENAVFIYGAKNDIQNILSQSTIGVLVSTSEGFPVSLLEYGLSALPTLSTNVGSCPEIIIDKKTGLLFNPVERSELKKQLNSIVLNKAMRDQCGQKLQMHVLENFSEYKILKLIISKYKIIGND
ncbi:MULTISPECIES: glycosyltransferase [unclassified Flavobacterium]|uniref:glycosyltransferase n=1 Tax=unclassified Flavobacterium TaxID=196869 RepID=UPI003F931955